MLTHKGESPYELYMNEHTDMEERPFAWPTDENPLAMPFEFPPSKSDVGGFGYDNLPEWLPPHNPPFGLDFAETDLYNTGMQSQYGEFNYFDGDTQRKPLPEMKDRSLERDRSSSTAQSSSKHGSKMPSLSQLKNRKAQKRFRERQKAKMINLSEEVEILRRQVQNLSMENRDLENSNMLLNKVVQMRDRQMNLLKAKAEAVLQDSQRIDNTKLPQLLNYTEGEAFSMERSLEVANHLTSNFPASKFADITQKDMLDVWKQYVDLLSGMLVTYETDPNNEIIQTQIKNGVNELHEMCMKCATLSPTSMCSLVRNGNGVSEVNFESEDVQAFWMHVLASLKLTPQQERMILELRGKFVKHLETIWKRRTLLSNQLQTYVMSKEDVFKSNVNSCNSASRVRGIFEELRDTCLTDCQYHMDFIASFFQTVLNEVQAARVYVESFPHYPDVLQISNLVHNKVLGERQGNTKLHKFHNA